MCYKTPYFMKNMCLLSVQFVLLLIIYLVYFRSDGGNMQNAMKILRGMNSDTFNYLESNKKKLNVNNAIPSFVDSWHAQQFPEVMKSMPFKAPGQEVNTVRFFS